MEGLGPEKSSNLKVIITFSGAKSHRSNQAGKIRGGIMDIIPSSLINKEEGFFYLQGMIH